jgi:phage terminase large subunit-like protein
MTRGEKVIAFIHKYCKVPEGKLVGQPITLQPFQRRFILECYDNPHGTKTGYLSIARKNGKSALIACLVLAHLVGPEARQNSQIVSGANNRDQAALIHALASKMIMLSPYLSSITRIIPSGKRLIGLPLNVEYRALAAEGKTAHGLSPVLAILDEVGQVKGPQSDFIDAILTSQGAHDNPLVLVVSTQAASDADLFSIWLDDAATGADPHTIVNLYTADASLPLMDPTGWAAANPALGVFLTTDYVKGLAEAAVRMPSSESSFRNLALNQRVSLFSPFISKSTWEANGGACVPFDKDTEVYGGLDLSMKADLTALVLIGRVRGKWHVRPYFWTPLDTLRDRAKLDRAPYDVWASQGFLRATPGKVISYETMAREITEICEPLNMHSIAYDMKFIDVLHNEFHKLGVDTVTPSKEGGKLPLAAFGQGYVSFAPAMSVVEEVFLNESVCHGMNPVLTMCAANSIVIMDPAGNRKLDKKKSTGRIDGMVALTMAFGAVNLAAADLDIGEPMVY